MLTKNKAIESETTKLKTERRNGNRNQINSGKGQKFETVKRKQICQLNGKQGESVESEKKFNNFPKRRRD